MTNQDADKHCHPLKHTGAALMYYPQLTAVLHVNSTYCARGKELCFQTVTIKEKKLLYENTERIEAETVVERDRTMRSYGQEDGDG